MIYSVRKPVKVKKSPKRKNGLPSKNEIQRSVNDAEAISNRALFSKDELEHTALIDGRGGDKTHDATHQAFLDLKDEHHEDYKECENNKDKQKIRDIVINKLEVSGTCFYISILNMNGMYRTMTIDEIRRKVSQALREPRKAKGKKCKVSQDMKEPRKTKGKKRKMPQGMANPRKALDLKCPTIIDPESCNRLQVAHALDSVDDELSNHEDNYQGTTSAMNIVDVDAHFNRDLDYREHFNQIVSDYYQDGIAADDKLDSFYHVNFDEVKCDSFYYPNEMQAIAYTDFFDVVDAIGNVKHHRELLNYQDADASEAMTMAHSQLTVECDIHEPINWEVSDVYEDDSVGKEDWRHILTVLDETDVACFRSVMEASDIYRYADELTVYDKTY